MDDVSKKNRKVHKKKKSSSSEKFSFNVYNASSKELSSLDSIYEINILEQGSILSKESSSLSEQEKFATTNVFPLPTEEVQSKENTLPSDGGMRIFANPFIESYYPVLANSLSQDTCCSSSSLLKTLINPEREMKRQSSYVGMAKKVKIIEEEKKNDFIETKSQTSDSSCGSKGSDGFVSSCDSDFKEDLKRQIIKTCSSILENESKWNSLTKSKRYEKDQLHLHHHEHHHYYYISGANAEVRKELKNECVHSGRTAEKSQSEIRMEGKPESESSLALNPEVKSKTELETQVDAAKSKSEGETEPQARTLSNKKKTESNPSNNAMRGKDSSKISFKTESKNSMNCYAAASAAKILKATESTPGNNVSTCTDRMDKDAKEFLRKISNSINSLLIVDKKHDPIKSQRFSDSSLSKIDGENAAERTASKTMTTSKRSSKTHLKNSPSKSDESSKRKTGESNSKIDLIDNLAHLTEIIGPDWKLENKKFPDVSYVKWTSLDPPMSQATTSKSSHVQSRSSSLNKGDKENASVSKAKISESKLKEISEGKSKEISDFPDGSKLTGSDSNGGEKKIPESHSKDDLAKIISSNSKPKVTKISIRENNNEFDVLLTPKRDGTGTVHHFLSGSGSSSGSVSCSCFGCAKKLELGRCRQRVFSPNGDTMPGKIPGTSQFTAEGNDLIAAARGFSFKIWTEKLRRELKQIKKELKTVEDRHREKQELLTSNRSEPEIAVYSSETYILGAEDVCFSNRESNYSGNHGEDQFLESLFQSTNFTRDDNEFYHLCYTPCTQLWRRIEHEHEHRQYHHHHHRYEMENETMVDKANWEQIYSCRQHHRVIKCVQSDRFPVEGGCWRP